MDIDSLKIEYFLEKLQKGVREVFSSQLQAAGSNIYTGNDIEEGRTGALREALSNPKITVATAGGGLTITSIIPEYTRFIDMKNHGNRVIYNKHVWGKLYKETMNDIRYEFRDWVETHYGEKLRSMMK